jgi:nucleotide-binding universal stress UspA family protein
VTPLGVTAASQASTSASGGGHSVTTDPLQARSFLVPIDGSDASNGALVAACEIARKTKATVSAVYIIEVPRSLPLDADLVTECQRGEEILERAEEIAASHNVRLDGDLLQARQAGHVIIDEAMERGADAIVIGLAYHRPYGRFELGRLAEYVLEHAPGLVWLIRYPMPAEPSPPSS